MRILLGRRLRDLVAFQMVPRHERRIFIYSEGKAYWSHLSEIVYTLLDLVDTPILYVSSDIDDPGLSLDHPKLRHFLTDMGSLRNWMFENLDADVAVMTMPDIDQFQVRRSRKSVHYMYVQHSMISLHMAYRQHAFSAFDSLCCAGPHHVEEARALEKKYSTPVKQLIKHGYGRVDQIMRVSNSNPSLNDDRKEGRRRRILIAPSWGPLGLIEGGCTNLIDILLANDFDVTLRPHPQTSRLAANKLSKITSRYFDHPAFSLEIDASGYETLFSSDVMISDWSGAAIDFAFGRLGPVIFLEVPRKINNPYFDDISIEPFEVSIREEIGIIIKPDEVNQIAAHAEAMIANSIEIGRSLRQLRDKYVFNLSASGRVAANEILRISEVRVQKPGG